MALSIPPERAVPEATVAILRHMAAAADGQGFDFAVIGAAARDLLLYHVHGEPTTRATRDVDVSVLVEDWSAFEALKDRLQASGAFARVPGRAHRLLYAATQSPLDLVPFGGVEAPDGTIAWPPDHQVLMSVVGFREAAGSAVQVAITDDLTVSVVALAALSLLKVNAWLDRRQETDRDAVDLLLLLRRYATAGNEDRLYDTETDLLASSGFDPELAGARLLGRDAVRLCGAEVTRGVLERMSASLRLELENQLLRQAVLLDEDAAQVRTHRLLDGFWSELRAAVA
ncbi:MAG: nucleotidyl transferase AbiEii/AbiGii toxin family protein [Acidobacteria bacterium]|nr:nucleotidyl transferase AbiEii/AbiGii toxin family protein [Acidobacteriota bacterium]